MKIYHVVIIALFFSSGCTVTPAKKMTPLEIQSMQSRSFEEGKNIVFTSVVSVFQDLGYTITNADIDTGLISAESSTSSSAAMRLLIGVSSTTQTRATAFIERIGSQTNARLNFVSINKTSSGYGQSDRKDTPILKAEIYQTAFEKIDSAIFVRTSSQ